MKYERIEPIEKTRAKKVLANGDRDAICRTLVSVAMFESDRRWAQAQCLRFAKHSDSFVRGVAATCLGTWHESMAPSTRTTLCRSCANCCMTAIPRLGGKHRMHSLIFLLFSVGIVASAES